VVIFATVFVLGPSVSTLGARAYFADPGSWHYLRNLLLEKVLPLPGVFSGAEVNGRCGRWPRSSPATWRCRC
jgi:hypothetical protein